MILKELAEYYNLLLDEGKVGKEGWAKEKVSYAVTIDYDGQVKSIFSIEETEKRGKKEVLVPAKRMVPVHSGRSGKTPKPYFLCDTAKYILGIWVSSGNEETDRKNKKQAQDYFNASALVHKEILKDSESKFL